MYDYPVLAWGHYGYRKEHHVTPDDVRKMASLYLVEKTTDCEKSAKEWRQADMAVRDFGMRYPRMEKVSKELRRMRKEQREFFKRAGIKRKEQ